MKTHSLISILAIIFFTACGSDKEEQDKDEDINYNTSLLPYCIESINDYDVADAVYKFNYNKTYLYGWTKNRDAYSITYNNGRIFKFTINLDWGDMHALTTNIDFEYKKHTIIATSKMVNSTTTQQEEYTINDLGYIIQKDSYYQNDKDIPVITKYTYSNSNLIKEELLTKNGNERIYLKEYNYDDKVGAFRNVNIPQWFVITQMSDIPFCSKSNNATALSYSGIFSEIGDEKYESINYEDDFPIKANYNKVYSRPYSSYLDEYNTTYTITYKEVE